jgi:hypothetical protein
MTKFLEIVPTYDKPYNAMSMAFIKSLLEAEGIKYFFEGEYSQTTSDISPLPWLYVLSEDFEKTKTVLCGHDLI